MNALFVLCGLGIVALVAEIVGSKKWLTTVMMTGLVVAAGLTILDWGTETTFYFSDMVVFDKFSLAFTALIIIVALLWLWMCGEYFQDVHQTDKTALVLFAIVGAVVMVCFNNMAMLFLGIEILSISLYALAGSRKGSLFSNEASFKYFLMGSFATGFLLLGIALVYGATASFQINVISDYIQIHQDLPGFFYAGVILMFIGLAFKISAVPFHFWAPDVYGGSPTSITAFMSTVVKIAAIGAFFRVFSFAFGDIETSWLLMIEVVCFLTLVIANITAVYQNDAKRMLAYSSVGHVGYILLGFLADPVTSSSVVLYYLAAYAVSSLGAFVILGIVEKEQNNLYIDSFNGLYKRNPFMAVALTIALLSLAGIPPLPGFFGKYMVFALALEHGFVGLVLVAVVTSLIGAYYYFRLIIAMYLKEPVSEPSQLSPANTALTTVLIVLTFLIGIFPNWLISLIGG